MKVTITKAEIIALVLNCWYLPADTTVEIVDTIPTPKTNAQIAKDLETAVKRAGCLNPWNDSVLPEKKILAIKTLRETIPNCGLAEAKNAIEDWDAFLSYVTRNGIPKMNAGVTWR